MTSAAKRATKVAAPKKAAKTRASGAGAKAARPAKEEVLSVRPLAGDDREWVVEFIRERWGAETVVAHGSVYRPERLAGFVAEVPNEKLGLVTYKVEGRGCEVVTLDAVRRGTGIGTALLEAVKDEARREECARLWLVTTNDNLDALRFFQRRGFELTRVYRGAIAESRTLKPEIPQVGHHGIPVRDELELEMRLVPSG